MYLWDVLSEFNQICYWDAPEIGKSTYQIWSKLCQSIPRYEQTNFKILHFLFRLFAHFVFSAITCERIFLLNWNLAHIKGLLKGISVLILVGMWLRFMELWLIFRVKKVEGLSSLEGKLLEGIGWNLACRWSFHHGITFLWFEEKTTEIWHKTQLVLKLCIVDKNPPSYTASVQSSELKISL